jgi:hypothetical protein
VCTLVIASFMPDWTASRVYTRIENGNHITYGPGDRREPTV